MEDFALILLEIDRIKYKFEEDILNINSLKSLESIRLDYLGKSGLLSEKKRNILKIPNEIKREFGMKINNVSNYIEEKINLKKEEFIKQEILIQISSDKIDCTLPGRSSLQGLQHIISKTIEEIHNICSFLGFEFVDGPEIETDFNNFTALNIPDNHPARNMHDTIYIKSKYNDNLLLRTHTTTIEIREMKKKAPPFNIYSIGRVYRSDNFDATHAPMFHQLECISVNNNISISNLKWLIQNVLSIFLNTKTIPLRFRSSYFPFTEPSFEVDLLCSINEFGVLKPDFNGDKWIEVLGCGLLHQVVLKNSNIDHKVYRGMALGAGIERLCMIKNGIKDLRMFFDYDVNWMRMNF